MKAKRLTKQPSEIVGNRHKTKWTVKYSSGAIKHFSDREAAQAEAYLYGTGIYPPLYM